MQRFVLKSVLVALVHASIVGAADWPQWRGPNRDGKSAETGLLQEWPHGGPQLRWKKLDIGTGYSSPAVSQGRVFIQTTRDDAEYIVTLDEQTSTEIWSTRIGTVGKNRGPNYPGTRSTPTTNGDLVFGLASGGQLVCLRAANGEVQWQRDLKEDFGGVVGNWAYSESVLVDGNAVVCTPGGSRAALAKLNQADGETIWESPIPGDDVADYASIMVSEGNGPRQYIQFLRKGLVGVDAETGEFLWRYDRTVDRGANILTPVLDNNRIFTAGSRSGGAVVQLTLADGKIRPDELFFERSLSPSIGGAVLIDQHLYGAAGDVVFCANFETGEFQWRDRSVGASSICYADGRLYLRGYNSGEVALVEPTPKGYRESGRFTQPNRSKIKAWPHPVVANGGFYLRDQDTLLCYDVKAN